MTDIHTIARQLESVTAIADDLCGYNPGHGDYRTAGKWLTTVLDAETAPTEHTAAGGDIRDRVAAAVKAAHDEIARDGAPILTEGLTMLEAFVDEIAKRLSLPEPFGDPTPFVCPPADESSAVGRVHALCDKWDDDTDGRHIFWAAVPQIRAAITGESA